jgi:hypothetical protein
MKTKEEIEQLAEEFTTRDHGHYHYRGKECFIKGYVDSYIQCQEDMADKKYTEEDIKKAFMAGCQSERRLSRRIDELDKYINSLNKQD